MGLFAELRRRNVFRVAAAYIVLGWLVLQVTDVAVPALRLPEWVPSLVFFLLALGFPFALLLSWAFELTPDGIRRERSADHPEDDAGGSAGWLDYALIGLLLAVVVLVIIDKLPTDEPVSPSALTSIAILPFENLSDDAEQSWFSDGLTEELISAFSRIEGLKVAGSVSSRVAGERQLDIREIGVALGVDSVLTGSVRRSDTSLRISVQLVDTQTGFGVWSGRYDGEMTEVFEVQDDIARNVLEDFRLQFGMAGDAVVSSTRNAVAYDHYLKGLALAREWDSASLQRAQVHFAAATAEDADFAAAWSNYALTQLRLRDSTSDTVLAGAETLNRRAFAIDPDLPEAHAVRAVILAEQYRYDEALDSNARAIDLRPGYADAYFWRYQILQSLGHLREAYRYLDEAYDRDRLNPRILTFYNTRECDVWQPRLSDERLAELSETLHPIESFFCHMRSRELAASYRMIETPMIAQVGGIWPIVNIKNCTEPFEGEFSADSQIIAMVACRMDEEALERFSEIAEQDLDNPTVLEWAAIAQLRLGQWERALYTLERAHGGRVPVAGRIAGNGISSNASLALGRVLASQQLNVEDPRADEIKAQVRQLVENLRSNDAAQGYRLLEAKLLLLDGRTEEAEALVVQVSESLAMGWSDAWDPVLLHFLGEERIRELIVALDAHVDSQRAELGWPPSDL